MHPTITLLCQFLRSFLLLLLSISLSVSYVYAQELTSWKATGRGGVATTFATDYHALGVNPANLAIRKSFRDPKVTFGFMEANIGFFAEKVEFLDVFRSFTAGSFFSPNTNYQFEYARKQQAVAEIANKPLSATVNATLFGVHFSGEKFGGLAFSVRDRMDFYSRTNETISSIIFLGQNSPYFTRLLLSNGEEIANTPDLPVEVREEVVFGFRPENEALTYGEVMDGSRVRMNWVREYNIAYGVKIFDSYNVQIFGGLGMRYISGISHINLDARNGQFVRDNISLSPSFPIQGFDIDNPSGVGYEPKSGLARYMLPKPIGNGYGIDIGLNMVIKRNLYIGASLINYGSIRWTGNVYSLNNGILAQIEGAGFDNYNFIRYSPETFVLGGEGSALSWTGSSEIEQELPTMIRAGISYDFFRTAHIGLDVVLPQNDAPGNLENPLLALGVDVQLNRIFTLSSGVSTGGNQGDNINIPVGITYNAPRRHYEIGFATQDLSSFIGDIEGGGNNISFALAVLRFKF